MLDVHDPNNVLPDDDFPEAARRFPPLARIVESLSGIDPRLSDRDQVEEILKAVFAFVGSLPPRDEIAEARRLLAVLMSALHDVDLGRTPKLFTPTNPFPTGTSETVESMALDYLAAALQFLVDENPAARKKVAYDHLASDLTKIGCECDIETLAARVRYRKKAKRGQNVPDMTKPIKSHGEYMAVLMCYVVPHLSGQLGDL